MLKMKQKRQEISEWNLLPRLENRKFSGKFKNKVNKIQIAIFNLCFFWNLASSFAVVPAGK